MYSSAFLTWVDNSVDVFMTNTQFLLQKCMTELFSFDRPTFQIIYPRRLTTRGNTCFLMFMKHLLVLISHLENYTFWLFDSFVGIMSFEMFTKIL